MRVEGNLDDAKRPELWEESRLWKPVKSLGSYLYTAFIVSLIASFHIGLLSHSSNIVVLYLMPSFSVKDNLGLVPTSWLKDHYIWLLTSQASLGTLYSSALLVRTITFRYCNNSCFKVPIKARRVKLDDRHEMGKRIGGEKNLKKPVIVYVL